MKQSLPLIAALIMLAVSWKKDPDTLPSEPLSVAQAKDFFEQNVINPKKSSAVLTSANRKSLRQLTAKGPLWKEAKMKKISIGDAVIIPLHYDKGAPYIKAGKKTGPCIG